MTNDEFRTYIDERLASIRKEMAAKEITGAALRALKEQEQLLSTAQRMARFSPGRDFHRFKRDYERRLARFSPGRDFHRFKRDYERRLAKANRRTIPEGEFRAEYERTRHELANLIARSGIPLAEIAKGTRLKWDTVYAASQGRAIRMENASRIRYYLTEAAGDNQEEDNHQNGIS